MQRPLAEVFTWPHDTPQLIGSRCGDCAATTFPAQSRCPRCGRSSMAELLLPRRGRLVAWTTQGFVPKLPYAGSDKADGFTPFGVGLVQLDDVIRVESRLTENDPAKLAFDMEMELSIVPFYVDDAGDEVMTFAFAPVSESTGSTGSTDTDGR
ncbi:DNA-binding protein [Frankia sp. R43]|uniref:Zn-ribbon domain-containing OB-fold protein n=1 Tax=Frankia sp. R43 TaxID=269536 RepID=UPI0006CA2621|nr:OB-fold domain-containing protein [Frankia sp. R43]KPM52208.1 DNA-binding protein [Frankia sp. R43]